MSICDCCENKHGILDLNAMNDCCYQSCANKLGVNNIQDVINSPCGRECKKCVDKSKLAQGRSLCYLRGVKPPVIWEPFESNYNKKEEHPVAFFVGFFATSIFLSFFIVALFIVIFGIKKK